MSHPQENNEPASQGYSEPSRTETPFAKVGGDSYLWSAEIANLAENGNFQAKLVHCLLAQLELLRQETRVQTELLRRLVRETEAQGA
jgi:hypothetical protein